MLFFRRVFNFMVAGTLLGIITASFVVPKYLTWDNTPNSGKALCDCADVTRQTADRIISAQINGGAIGAVVGLIAGIAISIIFRQRFAAAAAKHVAGPGPSSPA